MLTFLTSVSVVEESPSGILYLAVPDKEGIFVLLPTPATPKLRAVAVLVLAALAYTFKILP